MNKFSYLKLLFIFLVGYGCDVNQSPQITQEERAASLSGPNSGEEGSEEEETNSENRQTIHAEALAIGSEMSIELKEDLVGAGLTEQEADVIAQSAEADATVTADSLAIFSLASRSPTASEIAPAFLRGAMQGLALDGNGLGNGEDRAKLAEIVLSSTFGAINGHTKGWQSDTRDELEDKMAVMGLEQISNAGIPSDFHATATSSVLKGTVSALENSGVAQSALVETIDRLVNVSLDSIEKSTLDPMVRSTSIANVTSGSVAGLNTLAVSDEERMAVPGNLAQQSVQSVYRSGFTDDMLKYSISTISFQTGASILNAGFASTSDKATAMQNISKNMGEEVVSQVKNGNGDDTLEQLQGTLPLISSGLISSLDEAQLASSDAIENDVPKKIMAGAISSLKDSGLDPQQSTTLAGDVTSSAVQATENIVITDETVREDIIGGIVAGSSEEIEAAGITEEGSIHTAISHVTERAIAALADTSLPAENYDEAAAKIIGSAIAATPMLDQGKTTYTNDLDHGVSTVMEAGIAALTKHKVDGKISAEVLKNGAKKSTTAALNEIGEIKNEGIISRKEVEPLSLAIATSPK